MPQPNSLNSFHGIPYHDSPRPGGQTGRSPATNRRLDYPTGRLAPRANNHNPQRCYQSSARLIVNGIDARDVALAIRVAHTCRAPAAVCGGGYSVSGGSVVDDGVVIDLSEIRSAALDPAR
jgi:FAD/FMN-containing dehydrogenase